MIYIHILLSIKTAWFSCIESIREDEFSTYWRPILCQIVLGTWNSHLFIILQLLKELLFQSYKFKNQILEN